MIKVSVIGYKQVQQAISKMPQTIKKEVSTKVRLGAEQFRDGAIKDAPSDVSFLRSKIVVEPNTAGELKYEVISGSKYSAPMEFGTKGKFTAIPGIDSSEFKGLPTGGTFKEMVENITKWVKRKGIAGTYRARTYNIATRKADRIVRTGGKKTQDKQDKQVAYVIARSIVNNGVTPHPFFFKQLPIVRRDLIRNLRRTFKDFKG